VTLPDVTALSRGDSLPVLLVLGEVRRITVSRPLMNCRTSNVAHTLSAASVDSVRVGRCSSAITPAQPTLATWYCSAAGCPSSPAMPTTLPATLGCSRRGAEG